MPETNVYEYAVIRVVPQVEREEFLNVGVIVFCLKQVFLEMEFHLDHARLTCFSKELDIPLIQDHLHAWKRVCAAESGSGTIGRLAIGERFRWLTAARSTIIQTSRVHVGYCMHQDARQTLVHLFETLVK